MVREGERLQWNVEKKSLYSVLGQIQGTYILCEREGNLIFIDQHAAHERILFEKFKKEYETRSVVSEKLLIPILIGVICRRIIPPRIGRGNIEVDGI